MKNCSKGKTSSPAREAYIEVSILAYACFFNNATCSYIVTDGVKMKGEPKTVNGWFADANFVENSKQKTSNWPKKKKKK